MRRRLRQNATNASEIYIGRPIYISDVQSISDIRVPISDIRVPISDIRVPISDIRVPVSDIRYLYPTSDIYIGRPIYILDVRYLYLTSDIQCPTSARASARARARTGISDVGYRYRTSDIYIAVRYIYCSPIYILDVRYIYWTSDIDFGNIGGILS